MSRSLILALAISAAIGAKTQAQAVTWLHHNMVATAEWAGGDPIGGYSSYSKTDVIDTYPVTPSHYIQSWGLPVRVSMSIDDNLLDNPYPSSDFIQQKYQLSYNPVGDNGLDTSTHDFRAALLDQFVFSTAGCTLLSAGRIEQLTPYAALMVEEGTYSAGVFTATGVVLDLLSSNGTTIGPGTYRYTAFFDTGWFPKDSGFAYANNSGMYFTNEAVPEPASLAILGLGTAFLARRRKRTDR